MEELTAAQIAARIGKSERSVQRYIKTGQLTATPLANNRYAINPDDLAAFMLPEHAEVQQELAVPVAPTWAQFKELLDRVAALEEDVKNLEMTVGDHEMELFDLTHAAEKKTTTAKRGGSRQKSRRRKSEPREWLPYYLVSLKEFAARHGITEYAMRKAIAAEHLYVCRGNWSDFGNGRQVVRAALDETGQQEFYEYFHTHKAFKRCEDCPHRADY